MYINDNRRTVDHVNKKWVKVLTVITYIISVSVVGLILGAYYKLAWSPKYESTAANDLISNLTASGSSNLVINFKNLGVLSIKPHKSSDKKIEVNTKELEMRILNTIIDTLRKDKSYQVELEEPDNKDKPKETETSDLFLYSLKINFDKSDQKKKLS